MPAADALAQVKEALTPFARFAEQLGTISTFHWMRLEAADYDRARAALPALDTLGEELARLTDINAGLVRDFNSLLIREARTELDLTQCQDALREATAELIYLREYGSLGAKWEANHQKDYWRAQADAALGEAPAPAGDEDAGQRVPVGVCPNCFGAGDVAEDRGIDGYGPPETCPDCNGTGKAPATTTGADDDIQAEEAWINQDPATPEERVGEDAPRQKLTKNSGWWTVDDTEPAVGPLYYFAPGNRTAPPYLRQVHVEAILDIASDGTLAGVELVHGDLPPPPRAATPTGADT